MREEIAYQTETARGIGAVEALDQELERFDNLLERLEKTLAPAMSQYAQGADRISDPHPEPPTQLRGRTQRLSIQLGRLDRITSEVDL
jgi:hypothetical protein